MNTNFLSCSFLISISFFCFIYKATASDIIDNDKPRYRRFSGIPLESTSPVADSAKECRFWTEVAKSSLLPPPLKDFSISFGCTRNVLCTGINCSGKYSNTTFNFGLAINTCNGPLSVSIFGNIPVLGAKWNKTLTRGDTLDIAEEGIHLSTLGLTLKPKLKFGMTPAGNELVVNLKEYTESSVEHGLFLPKNFSILHNLRIPLPDCSRKSVNYPVSSQSTSSRSKSNQKAVNKIEDSHQKAFLYLTKTHMNEKKCDIGDMDACDDYEICEQKAYNSQKGICRCQYGYQRKQNGSCTLTEETPTDTTVVTVINVEPENSTSKLDSSATASSSLNLILTATLVPLLVIVLLSASIYALVRYKLCQPLPRRLRVRASEHMLLDQDDEELQNPAS
ncbi:uncharacterized protein LOC111083591 [Limulus polyphemus]|uniref:Uncharacterized protein LOC111083591 n=1 Tax=Limulus polyphemus TaxID=6850 RepID=A0ABM1RX09_LIMPO|nr:uncharacterized protein LOC111083591 [Limulus polyphemus]